MWTLGGVAVFLAKDADGYGAHGGNHLRLVELSTPSTRRRVWARDVSDGTWSAEVVVGVTAMTGLAGPA